MDPFFLRSELLSHNGQGGDFVLLRLSVEMDAGPCVVTTMRLVPKSSGKKILDSKYSHANCQTHRKLASLCLIDHATQCR